MWVIKMGFFPLYLIAGVCSLLSKAFGLIARSLDDFLRGLFEG